MGETPAVAASGWETGASKRLLALGAARAVAQALAFAWFLLAARLLSDRDFGVVATGLALFSILSGLGDLGTTRTVVRYVAADPHTLWPTYRRALPLRIAGGAGVAALATGLVALAGARVEPVVVVVAGAIAIASGATELAYAALRSVGRVGAEMATLVAERALFLAVGWASLAFGAGPIAVLVVYVVTNAISAVITGVLVRQAQPTEVRTPGPLTDREARRTAVASALVAVSPSASGVILAVVAGTNAVAAFSVAQRPVQAAVLFAIATAAPVLPMLRAQVARQRMDAALHTARAVLGALAVALAPIVAWWMVAPRQVLDLLVGPGRYPRADAVLVLVALTAVSWALRGIGEFLLLAQERAGRFLRITMTGLAVNVVLGVPLAAWRGAPGAAVALVASEAVMTAMLLAAVPALVSRDTARLVVPAVAIGAISALTLMAVRQQLPMALTVLGAWSAIAVAVAMWLVRRLEVAV